VYFKYICWKFAGRLLDRVNTALYTDRLYGISSPASVVAAVCLELELKSVDAGMVDGPTRDTKLSTHQPGLRQLKARHAAMITITITLLRCLTYVPATKQTQTKIHLENRNHQVAQLSLGRQTTPPISEGQRLRLSPAQKKRLLAVTTVPYTL